jgi:hypothetical protein
VLGELTFGRLRDKMNKRGIIRLGIGLFILLFLLILVLSLFFSSASENNTYLTGGEAKIDLANYTPCVLKITSPSGEEIKISCEDKFSLKFEEPGEYIMNIKSQNYSERMKFQVYPRIENKPDINCRKNNCLNNEIQNNSILFNFKQGNIYSINTSLKFDFNNTGKYKLMILSPSGKRTVRVSYNDFFFFKLVEEGNYSIHIKMYKKIYSYDFIVIRPIPEQIIQGKAEINKPVEWGKILGDTINTNLIEIPNSATNLTFKNENGNLLINYTLTQINGTTYIQFNENLSGNIQLEYTTEPPKIEEKLISNTKKEVIISSPEDVHYENVTAYTLLPREISDKNLIKIYWKEENTYLNFEANDTDNNSLLDYVEWIVPHLSNQTFEIILITKALHLSSDRTFISDVYEQVKALDNIWSEEIPDGDYVRVTFETPLDSTRDITLYPRVISGNPIIEVYEVNKTEKIAEFSPLVSDESNKVYLTNLIGIQDTFDLKVVGGSVQLDYIVDPSVTYNFNDRINNRAYNYTDNTNVDRWVAGTEFPTGGYTNIASLNNANATVTAGGSNDYNLFRFVFKINETSSLISWINITLNGGETCSGTVTAFVFNWTGQTWTTIANVPSTKGIITLNLSGGNAGFHIGSTGNNVTIAVDNPVIQDCDGAEQIRMDYVKVDVTYTPDTTPPIYNLNSTNNTIAGQITRFAINVTDNLALHPNGGYIFSTNNSGSWQNDSFVLFSTTPSWANVSKLLNSTAGTRVGYRWYFNDSYSTSNTNSTPIYTLLTTDGISPYFTTIPANASLFYANQSLLVTFVATDETGFGYYRINDTRFSINQTGFLSNATPMAYGDYEINVTINDTTGNINWTRYKVQINKSMESCRVLFNESSPVIYPGAFLVWANCTTPFVLMRNGTTISNNSVQSLALGAYNFSFSRNDSVNYSIIFNQSQFIVSSSAPPVANQIECEESGTWKSCTQVHFGDIITRVRANCTGTIVNASFNLTNTPDAYTFFNSNATSNSTTSWIYDNNDLIINDSGQFLLNATCYGSSSQSSNYTNWTVPWGNLTVELVNPRTNTNVNPNEFFNFTVNVTCTGGECGFVNATLDPVADWWNFDYINRKRINITNPSSLILVQNYSIPLTIDTTGINFQDDGDDLRIVFWNGTANIELDRFNDTIFDLTTTNIWFGIQSNVSGGGYDDNYYMYYNNSEASNPPNNGSRVFEFFDNFNRVDNDTIGNDWTESSGTWEILNNWVRNTNNGDSDLTRTTTTNNHSVRALANQVITDADLKVSVRSALSPTRGYTYGYQNGVLEITSGNHNTANLGSVATSTMAGVPYELEVNAFGSRITAYKDNSLIFNVTDTSVSSGITLLHSWDVSEFDDVWVRKLIDIEPTSSLGNSEVATKGIISTTVGAIPFYTISRNPMDYIGTSCLANMKSSGGVCNVTWQVNATGKIGSVWNFFAFVNTTNYTNYFNSSDLSSSINITIGNLPPSVPELNFPANASALTSIGEFNWSNSVDPTGDTIYYAIQVSNTSDFSYLFYANYSIPERATITGITPTGISQEGVYYWRVLATDSKANSSWSGTRVFYYDLYSPNITLWFPENNHVNTTSNTFNFIYSISDISNITNCSLIINNSINSSSTSINKSANNTLTAYLPNSYYSWAVNCTDAAGRVGSSETRYLTLAVSNNPPAAREIQCEKSGSWYNCSSIAFGNTLTRVRVRCTDPENGVVNATLNLTNTPDGYNYFYNTTTTNSGEYWTFDNPDIIINDSGEFRVDATCYDSESLSSTNLTTWTVPWGSLSITLLNPNANTSVMRYSFFNFSSRITCVNGECGGINATLDPLNWWNETWYYRKTINITNSGSTTLSNFTVYLNLSKELSMQTDFDDIRFINGSCGSSANYLQMNYEIENYTSSRAHVWVKISSFVPGANQICMYYGNSFVSSGQNLIETWNSSYMMVQHLEEPGTGSRNDSTSNRRNMTASGYDNDEKTTGKVDGADILDGSNDALNSSSSFLNSMGSFTLEGWIKPRVWGSRISLYGQNDVAEFFLDGSNTVMIWTSGGGSTTTSYPYSLDTWHYVVATGNGSNLAIYFDGTQSVVGGSSTADYGTSIYSVKIGEGVVDVTGGFFNGSIDEVRISNTSRSSDWINQTYQLIQNQNTFVLFGSAEEKSKGIISTTVGATPFYTITQNPLNSSTTGCLSNAKSSGGYCDLTWQVNATGELNSIWEFFVTAHNLDYWSYFNASAESSRINITIATQVPPTVPQLYRPLNATAYSSIPNLNWTNSTDQNGDTIYYAIQVSNTSDFSYINFANYSIRETANPTNKTPTGISQEGTYYWKVLASDLIENSSWSETRVFYYVTSVPTITLINQTGEDNRIINSSNWLNRGENLTIFTNVSGISIDRVWIVVWQSVIGGVEKIRVFFTSLGNSLWRANVPTNQTWDGFYNYTIYANDTLGSQINYSSNFTVLGGNVTINLTPLTADSIRNITAYGHVNLTNGTNFSNRPINLWLDGRLLFFSNLTGEGTYDYSQEFLESSSTQFSQGTFYQTQMQNNENITLSSGVTSGNFTKTLDAGAIVSWNNLSWGFSGASCSGVFSYQEGDSNSYSGTRDTYIDSGSANSNYANSDVLVDGSPAYQRGLIKFDNVIGRAYYQIPENSTINNANITLQISDTGDLTSIYQVLENWTETGATYNNRLTSTAWGSSGCGGSPSRSTTLEDSFTASSTGTYTMNITNSFKSWISGASQNYGWVFDIPTSNGINIRSSEYSTQSERPLLMVDYQASECTNVIVYIRTSNDKITWTSWQQVSNGGSINDTNTYSRYLQYRVEFTSVNSTITPVLNDITINYTGIITDSNGDYRYNFTNPSQFGNHPVIINTSLNTILMNNSASLYVETGVAPNVSLVSPSTNQWFSYGNLTLVYNTTDVNDNFAYSELIINGTVNQTNSTPIVNYAYNNFTINFSSGYYTWTVNVTDTTSYRATDSQRTFYIDLIDPNISLIYPDNLSSFTVNQLNLSFNATDNLDNNLTCSIVLDGNTIRSGVGAANGNITNVSSGTIGSGIHYWNVTCADNVLRNFTSSTFNFNISDTPPNVTLVSPTPNYLDSDGIMSFIYNASDNTGFINCSLIINGTYRTWNQSAINNYQNNAFDVEGLLEGNYNWTVECFDLSATSNKPLPRNFSEDLYKPTIVLNSPDNSGTSTTSRIYFNLTVNDTFDHSLNCNLTINSVVVDTFSANSGNLTTRPISGLTDGLKYWNVTCIDDTLNSNTSATWTVNVTVAPLIFLNTSNNSRFNQTSINLTYTPSDNTNLSSCDLYINGVFNQSNSTSVLNNQGNNFTLNGIPEGTYNWTVNCSDYSGLSNQSQTRIFYADRSPPQINISYPRGEDVYSSNVSFNFTLIDTLDSNLSCNITVNSSVVAINFSANNGSMTTKDVSGISEGYHVWNLTCWDRAGNLNISDTFNFTKYTNPQVTLISPGNSTWFNNSNIDLIYLPEDDGGIVNASLFINGIYNGSNSTPIINQNYNNFSITGFSDGIYYWNVNVTDPTGLTGIGAERRFYIDSQPPSVILNSPNGSSIIATNNVTFNFTIFDNLAQFISCNFTVNGELESSRVYSNNSRVIRYSTLGDGDHNWKVDCVDNASNFNYSDTFNFTVEAPPSVNLNLPADNFRTTNSSISFNYTPYDLIQINNCTIYLDGVFNQSNTSISKNTLNNFTIDGIQEGMHNWTVNCSDYDWNWNWSTERIFYRDISPPSMILNSPDNNSGISYNESRVYFNWTAIDVLDTILQCNLTIDGITRLPNLWVTNRTPKRDYVLTSVLSQGEHSWNVTCWDQLRNTNTSELRKFNLTYPDFFINSSEIYFNESSPKENQSIEITATIHNLAAANISNVTIKFYNGDPDSGGIQIGTSSFTNLSELSQINITKTWSAQMGSSEIFVVVDPPTSTNGSYIELNESNNKASKSISVGSWQFFYGDVLSSSNFVLMDNGSGKLINWSTGSSIQGNIHVADYDSYISWNQLQSIGKTKSNTDSSSDFSEMDTLLNSTTYADSIYLVYTNSGTPKYKSNIYSFNEFIQEVPIINSTNNSNFLTGILWDTSDDTNGTSGEFDLADKEDIVFVSPINKQSEGAYGIYDYEIRVPAKLRQYRTTDTRAAAFYVEIS